MVLCGISIAGFTLSVFCRRRHARAGQALAMAAACHHWVLRLGRLYRHGRGDEAHRSSHLVEITKRMRGAKRSLLEITNRLVILLVGLAMLCSAPRTASTTWEAFAPPP
jgi:hypothetical protein